MSVIFMDKRDMSPIPDEAIAIIGMSCRLPQATDIDAFWNLLREGRNAVGSVSDTRWRASEGFSGDLSMAEFPGADRGGFIDDVDMFDSEFFEISPREASGMDPQQRLALELGWEA